MFGVSISVTVSFNRWHRSGPTENKNGKPLFSTNGAMTTLSLPLYLFLIITGAATFFLILQRPWKGQKIEKAKIQDVIVGGVILAVTLYVYTAGLRACGPLRTLLLDGSELPMLYAFKVVTGRNRALARKTRGVFLVLLAYSLVLYDASGRAPGDAAALKHTKIGMTAENALERIKDDAKSQFEKLHLRNMDGQAETSGHERRLLAADDGFASEGQDSGEGVIAADGDNVAGINVDKLSSESNRVIVVQGGLRIELGVMLVLCSSAITLASSGFRKQLALHVGGAKRSFALSVSVASLAMFPFALLSAIRENERFSVADIRLPSVVNIGLIGFLWIVLPYYIRANLTNHISNNAILRAAPVNFVLAALLATFTGYGTLTGTFTWPLALAFLLNVAGLYALSLAENVAQD